MSDGLYLSLVSINTLSETSKLTLTTVDTELEASVVNEIFAQVGQVYNTALWTNASSTPKLIKSILAMFYVGWYYQKVYSEDSSPSSFGILQIQRGQRLVDGIIEGSLDIPDGVSAIKNDGSADHYPSDASSIMSPTVDDRSLGGPFFSMSDVF